MKKLFIVFIALIFACAIVANTFAALGGATWTSNNDIQLTINNGQSAQFEYRIQAVTSHNGKFSIYLYKEGDSNPIKTYLLNQPTVNNGAGGYITIQPEDYGNTPGNYYILIYSVDDFCPDTFKLIFSVNTNNNPIVASCTANPTSGNSPLNTIFTVSASGGSGKYAYSWNFNDGDIDSSLVGTVSHIYTSTGTFNPSVNVADDQGQSVVANCPSIIVNTPPINAVHAIFTFDPQNAQVYQDISFDASQSYDTQGHALYYNWDFGDGTSGHNVMMTHSYSNPGTYDVKLTVVDSTDSSITDTVTHSIVVTGTLNIIQIDCFDKIIQSNNQSCQVYVTANNHAVSGANVNIYFLNGNSQGAQGDAFGNCVTDISGACTIYKTMDTVGQYTIYATASKSGYVNDTDTYPRKTFDVLAKRYDVLNLATYGDSEYTIQRSIFYRGQPLFIKFQVYDPDNSVFVSNDIVTAASLISNKAGGRADLTKISFSNNWYYYYLDQIPLTHAFIGDSNVFAFAFNFTGNVGGQAQVSLTILNNAPKALAIPNTELNVGEMKNIDLYNYASDLEDGHNLRWQISNSPSITNSVIETDSGIGSHPILKLSGISPGEGDLGLVVYDLDNDHDGTSVHITVNNVVNNGNLKILSCSADPSFGNSPLTTIFNSNVIGGVGSYLYNWDFGDGTSAVNGNIIGHTYSNVGVYNVKLNVTDYNGNFASMDCGYVTVNHQSNNNLTAICSANPTSGNHPLNVMFNVISSGGSGIYNYVWHFDDGTIFSNNNMQETHLYDVAKSYNPSVVVYDTSGNTVNVVCPIINVYSGSSELSSNIGGPYAGYLNEALSFDASQSTGTISKYSFDFGDGTSADSTYPQIAHTYNKTGFYNVALKVFDSSGNSRMSSTTATIIEREYVAPVAVKTIPTDDLLLNTIQLYGNAGEIFTSNDVMTVSVDVENQGTYRLKDAKLIVEIPDLGIRQESDTFDLGHGREYSASTNVDLYDVPKGTYYVKIIVGDDTLRRVKYRDIVVK